MDHVTAAAKRAEQTSPDDQPQVVDDQRDVVPNDPSQVIRDENPK